MKLEHHNPKSGDRVQIMLSDQSLVDALAYAVESGIPPEDVLEAFQEAAHNNAWNRLLFWNAWDHPIELLRSGYPVSAVLRERSAPYYLCSAAAYAEANGTLPQVLPVLARNMQLQRFFAGNAISLVFRNLFLWLAMLLVMLGMFVFIKPNLMKLFDDLIPGSPISPIWPYLSDFIWLPVLLIAFIISFAVAMNVHAFEVFYLHLPLLGGIIKRRVLHDLSGMFYCLLASGMDISHAARAAAESEPRWWLRRRLKKFAKRIENGEDWLSSWSREIRLRTPVSCWILQSGHLTGKLAESFNNLQSILLEENLGSDLRLNTCVSILIIFANALVIDLFGFAFFSTMVYIIERV